jgi:hypothetical protein
MDVDELRTRIADDFKFHPADENTGPMHQSVRDLCLSLAGSLTHIVPVGRELSLALTNLEQVMFWANAGIARAEKPADEAV